MKMVVVKIQQSTGYLSDKDFREEIEKDFIEEI